MQYSHFMNIPLTLLQTLLTLKYSPSGQVTDDPQQEELLVFHVSHQDKQKCEKIGRDIINARSN